MSQEGYNKSRDTTGAVAKGDDDDDDDGAEFEAPESLMQPAVVSDGSMSPIRKFVMNNDDIDEEKLFLHAKNLFTSTTPAKKGRSGSDSAALEAAATEAARAAASAKAAAAATAAATATSALDEGVSNVNIGIGSDGGGVGRYGGGGGGDDDAAAAAAAATAAAATAAAASATSPPPPPLLATSADDGSDDYDVNETKNDNNNNINNNEDADDDDTSLWSSEDDEFKAGVNKVSSGRNAKYDNDDITVARWIRQKKHLFILSSAGKPIYSRYGDAISGLVSFVADSGDKLRYVCAGDHIYVFLIRGPIFLVFISQTGESESLLSSQLNYVHQQIISILTRTGIAKIFASKAQFDLRTLLGGTEVFIDHLMHRMERDPSFFLNAVCPLRLPPSTRSSIGQILQSATDPNILFSILISRHQLVHMVRPKKFVLEPLDLHLLINFVTASRAFRQSETWTPICLPTFNDRGFLHSYICYIAEHVCLVLISTNADAFFELSECRTRIVNGLVACNALATIEEAETHYHINDVQVPSLLHFIYKSRSTNQLTYPKYSAPYMHKEERIRLFRLYQHVFERVNSTTLVGPHKVYYHVSDYEIMIGWTTAGFELLATFGPLETKSQTIRACNQLLRFIKKEEDSLFILNSPSW